MTGFSAWESGKGTAKLREYFKVNEIYYKTLHRVEEIETLILRAQRNSVNRTHIKK